MERGIVALDLETTGLKPENDHILEIGAVKILDGKIQDTYSVFINEEIEIPEFVKGLTGITEEMIRQEGISLEEGILKFLSFAEDLPILGHNILFDYGFLKQNALNLKLSCEMKGVDTLKISRKLLASLESRSLEALCDHYGICQEKKHRAFEDALSAYRVYRCMEEEFRTIEPEIFEPQPLIYKVKKQSPITISQKRYLNDLIKYHRIEMVADLENMTKSQASKLIDHILSNYGRIKR